MSEALQSDPNEAPPGGGSWKLYLLAVLAVLLFGGGAVFYHFSARNARVFWVEQSGQDLLIRKGIFFPTGSVLADAGPAYAPFALLPETSFVKRRAGSLEEVDRVLFLLLTDQTRQALSGRDEAGVAQAKEYLRRARMLASIGDKEEEVLLRLKGDMDMARGVAVLRTVVPTLERALKDLQRAEAHGTQTAESPDGWIRWVGTRVEEFGTALRTMRPPPEFASPGSAAPRIAEPTADAVPPPGEDAAPTGIPEEQPPTIARPPAPAPVPAPVAPLAPTPAAPGTVAPRPLAPRPAPRPPAGPGATGAVAPPRPSVIPPAGLGRAGAAPVAPPAHRAPAPATPVVPPAAEQL